MALMSAVLSNAQLTPEQRRQDMQQIANVLAKNYAPYEWKREAVKFDLYDLAPWLAKAEAANSDLGFYDVLGQYLGSLRDTHTYFDLPSDFAATLPLRVDLYDGKVLIESITRGLLPAAQYPFQVGDELVSLDGRTAQEWIEQLRPFAALGNKKANDRYAAGFIPVRVQAIYPRAHEIGEKAKVEIRRANGDLETYEIAWVKSGTPMEQVGPVPTPRRAERESVSLPEALRPLAALNRAEVPASKRMVSGWGSRSPVFAAGLPADFQQRLGRGAFDEFFSGTYTQDGVRIGFLRIPSFDPSDYFTAVNQMLREVQYFDQNTDVLVVDVTRNPGGFVDVTQIYLQMLNPEPFDVIGLEIRATAQWVRLISETVAALEADRAPEAWIAAWKKHLEAVRQANRENRGRTGSIPLTADGGHTQLPLMDRNGTVLAYKKPIVVLTDEFTTSGGDNFAAAMQDNRRGLLFGMPTNGAGGSVNEFQGTTWTEVTLYATESLMTRKQFVITPDYPMTRYVENVGVRPDVEYDMMTRENLTGRYSSYVEAFTRAAAAHAKGSN
jgi:hypothetical protein